MNRATKLSAAVVCVLASSLIGQGCGDDDDDSAADGGADTGADQSGSGGAGGRAGSSGRGGSGGRGGQGSDDDAGVAEQPVTIRFKATVGDEELVCGREYDDQGSSKIKATPQDFRFFVESVKLIAKDGSEVPVRFDERAPFQTRDVALLDFTNGQGSCAPGTTTNTTITGKVPAGEYNGIVFVNGVPESVNHQNIAVAKPPLQDASTYWGWQSGYRFIMAELLPTTLPEADAGADPTGGASFVHIGSGGCSGANATGFSCSRANRNAIKLSDFDPENDMVVADLGKVFANVNLETGLECHGPSPACSALYSALGLELATGTARDAQEVFRVE